MKEMKETKREGYGGPKRAMSTAEEAQEMAENREDGWEAIGLTRRPGGKPGGHGGGWKAGWVAGRPEMWPEGQG